MEKEENAGSVFPFPTMFFYPIEDKCQSDLLCTKAYTHKDRISLCAKGLKNKYITISKTNGKKLPIR